MNVLKLKNIKNTFFPDAPSQPVISVSSQGQLVASQVVTLTCSSQGGNPAPSVRWYRDGRQISANTRTAPPRQKFGTTTGTLTWTLTKRDHGVEFSCAVENTGNRDNPRTTSRKLEVQCECENIITKYASNIHSIFKK